jgi:hypothetical protein
MKSKELEKIIRDGARPLVKLTDMFWEESFGEKGMIARITGVSENSWGMEGNTGACFRMDYMENKTHNISLQTANWYDKDGEPTVTKIESGNIKEDELFEDALFDDAEDEVPIEFIDGVDSLMGEYVTAVQKGTHQDRTYVEWLEGVVRMLRRDVEGFQRRADIANRSS